MSGTASLPSQPAPSGLGAEVDDLLRGVTEFVRAEIDRRTTAFDTPPSPAEIVVVVAAAAQLGLLDGERGGAGLWAPDGEGGSAFAALALRAVARSSTAAALAIHSAALAELATRTLWGEAAADGATVALSGRLSLGGAALGRLLGRFAPAASDETTLADLYGRGERLRWTADPGAQWLAPLQTGDGMVMALLPGGGEPDVAPHGPDGLLAVRSPLAGELRSAPLTTELLSELTACHQLGLVAIAQGVADTATARALEYARSRAQGGQAIIGHDAVALMAADQRTALLAVEAQVAALAGSAGAPGLVPAIALRRTAAPALHAAVDAAVQMHGGSGYMRDTGVEHLLRDSVALMAIDGTGDDLGLILAALTTPDAAVHGEAGSAREIAGHVAPGSPLDPQNGFLSHPILRLMSSYRVAPTWERDSGELPAALRGYRRRLRDFAARELQPHALTLDLEMRDADARPAALERLRVAAARAGLFGDLLPKPVGSVPPHRYRHSLVLQQVLKTEELSYADGGLMLYLSAHNLGLAPVLFSGNRHAYRDVVLPALRACANGNPQTFAFAITEPGAGSDAEHGHGAATSSPGLTAARVPGGWELSGSKMFISGGDLASWVVAFAALEDEGFDSWTAFLLDTSAPGFSRLRNEHKMGMRASGATALAFDRCFVPDALVLGGLRGGWALNRATLNFSRLPVASMAVGFAQRATDIATQFACHETLGGRPLIDRQHVQIALAEMQAETAAIRALVWQFSQRRVPEQAKASIAKFQASDRAQVVIERAIGLLGAGGLLHERELEKVFRDNRLVRIFEGTNQINRLAVIEDQQELLLAEIGRAPRGARS